LLALPTGGPCSKELGLRLWRCGLPVVLSPAASAWLCPWPGLVPGLAKGNHLPLEGVTQAIPASEGLLLGLPTGALYPGPLLRPPVSLLTEIPQLRLAALDIAALSQGGDHALRRWEAAE
jgi:hypothetical protein